MKKLLISLGAIVLTILISITSTLFWDKVLSENDLSSIPQKQPNEEKVNQIVASSPPKKTVTFSFGGDVLLADRVGNLIKQHGDGYILSDVKPVLQSADIAMVNFESPISTRGVREKDKQYTFRARPEHTSELTSAGIDIVTLANNHVLDFGIDALLDTFQNLDKHGILYAGAGRDIMRASEPVFITKNDTKVAIIASSHVIPFSTWAAGAKKPGVATTYNPSRIKEEIAKAKSQANVVAVYVHWGIEMKEKPVNYQKNLAKLYIDEGADIVIGSHPHVLQGLEFYKGKIIAYSLGNFVFTNYKKDTMILNIEAEKGKINEVKLIPCQINNCKPYLVKDTQRREAILEKVESISFDVDINAKGIAVPKSK
ncbi:MAG: CapA family protein [Clostridia bacterium]|nr:CapA family protein [Clostridia bacterium]